VDQGHGQAELAQRSCHLHPDEAAADHDRVLGRARRRSDCLRVPQRPQRIDPVEVRSRHRESTRCRAGRDQQLVVVKRAGIGRNGARAGIDGRGRRVEQHFDVMVAVERRVLRERGIGRLTAQVALRQRRAVVREIALFRQQRDLAAAAGLAVGLDRARGR
jgi:hypothetical protein